VFYLIPCLLLYKIHSYSIKKPSSTEIIPFEDALIKLKKFLIKYYIVIISLILIYVVLCLSFGHSDNVIIFFKGLSLYLIGYILIFICLLSLNFTLKKKNLDLYGKIMWTIITPVISILMVIFIIVCSFIPLFLNILHEVDYITSLPGLYDLLKSIVSDKYLLQRSILIAFLVSLLPSVIFFVIHFAGLHNVKGGIKTYASLHKRENMFFIIFYSFSFILLCIDSFLLNNYSIEFLCRYWLMHGVCSVLQFVSWIVNEAVYRTNLKKLEIYPKIPLKL
jgi:hypothetical protein